MAKFHISPKTGNPGACRATKACPFGGEDEHYGSRAEAQAAYEKQRQSFEPGYSVNSDPQVYADDLRARARAVKRAEAFVAAAPEGDFLPNYVVTDGKGDQVTLIAQRNLTLSGVNYNKGDDVVLDSSTFTSAVQLPQSPSALVTEGQAYMAKLSQAVAAQVAARNPTPALSATGMEGQYLVGTSQGHAVVTEVSSQPEDEHGNRLKGEPVRDVELEFTVGGKTSVSYGHGSVEEAALRAEELAQRHSSGV